MSDAMAAWRSPAKGAKSLVVEEISKTITQDPDTVYLLHFGPSSDMCPNLFWSATRSEIQSDDTDELSLWKAGCTRSMKTFLLRNKLSPQSIPADFLWTLFYSLPRKTKELLHYLLRGKYSGQEISSNPEFDPPYEIYLLMEKEHETPKMFKWLQEANVDIPSEMISKIMGPDAGGSKFLKLIEGDISELEIKGMLDPMLTKEYMLEQYSNAEKLLQTKVKRGVHDDQIWETLQEKVTLIQELLIRAYLQNYNQVRVNIYGKKVQSFERANAPVVPFSLTHFLATFLRINICVIDQDNYHCFLKSHGKEPLSLVIPQNQHVHGKQKLEFSSFFQRKLECDIFLMQISDIDYVSTKLAEFRNASWRHKSISELRAIKTLEEKSKKKFCFCPRENLFLEALRKSVFEVITLTDEGQRHLVMLQRENEYGTIDSDGIILALIMDYVNEKDKWEEIYNKIEAPMFKHKQKKYHVAQKHSDRPRLPDLFIWNTIEDMRMNKRVGLDKRVVCFGGMKDIVSLEILTEEEANAYKSFPSFKDFHKALPKDEMDMRELEEALPGRDKSRATSPLPEIPDWKQDYQKVDLHEKFDKVYADVNQKLQSQSITEAERDRLHYIKKLVLEILVRADLYNLKHIFLHVDKTEAPTWIFDIVVEMVDVPLHLLDCKTPNFLKVTTYDRQRHARPLRVKPLSAEVAEFQPQKKPTLWNPGARDFTPGTKFPKPVSIDFTHDF